jgi:hypothetical protein
MSCETKDCSCRREQAVNIFSKDFHAGVEEGRKGEATRTLAALTELRDRNVLTVAQVEAVLDLILEKLLDVRDID